MYSSLDLIVRCRFQSDVKSRTTEDSLYFVGDCIQTNKGPVSIRVESPV